MAGSEFEIIRRYFARFGARRDWLAVGIGDDAAVISPPTGLQQLIAIDTLNAGIHFPLTTSATDIGYKALAVNISDIASMGGEPQWFTLAISLPSEDDAWLADFCAGMSQLVEQYQLTLIGGDTTHGPLSVTIQITGHVPVGKAILRSGAKADDDIYVTGHLGNAAAGLLVTENKLQTNVESQAEFLRSLNRPVPRVAVGQQLREIASACIDISDGLAADLGHILTASHAGAEVNLNAIPVSKNLRQQTLSKEQMQQLTLFGGDDYELCFTANITMREHIARVSELENIPITRIGRITSEPGLIAIEDDTKISLPYKGYDHFA